MVEFRLDRSTGAVEEQRIWNEIAYSSREEHSYAVEGELEATADRSGAIVRETIVDLVPIGGNAYTTTERAPMPPVAYLSSAGAVASTTAIEYERRAWAPGLAFLAAWDEGGAELRVWDGSASAGFVDRNAAAATGQARPIGDIVPVADGWVASAPQAGLGLVIADLNASFGLRRAFRAESKLLSSFSNPVPLALRDSTGVTLAGFDSDSQGGTLYRTVFAAPDAVIAAEAAVALGPSGHRLRHRLIDSGRILALCGGRAYRIDLADGLAAGATELDLAGFDPSAFRIGFGADGGLIAAGPAAVTESDNPPGVTVIEYQATDYQPKAAAYLAAAPLPNRLCLYAYYRVVAVAATTDQYVLLVHVHQL